MSVYGNVYRVAPILYQPQAKVRQLTPPNVFFSVVIGGTDRTLQVVKGTVSITYTLTQQPNTARMSVYGFTPTAGQLIYIQSGTLIFAGTVSRVIQKSTPHAQGAASYLTYDVECIDWTWLLNRRRVTKTYASGSSATAVVLDILSNYTSGFTSANVASGAPTLTSDLIFRGQLVTVALQQVCDAVAYAFYVDVFRDVHFYSTATATATTSYAAATAGTSFVVPANVTQVLCKAWGGGGGASGDNVAGGGGGYASSLLTVLPGETLTVRVGGGGSKDVNAWQAGGGGGYSGVFRSTTPLLMAGGGGGGSSTGAGGAGGGTTGIAGSGTGVGGGGTQSAGGAAGTTSSPADVVATAGSLAAGGTGGGYSSGTGSAGASGGTNGGGAGGAKGSATSTYTVSYLVVAGGGGGGNDDFGGGGGGGGVRAGSLSARTGAYTVIVGPGGTVGANGSDSSALGITSTGGGAGAAAGNGAAGGSGGGASGAFTTGGAGTVGQGSDGGSGTININPGDAVGGGGGGAGSAGGAGSSFGPPSAPDSGTGGNGGNGVASSISGSSVTYGGGGGGNAAGAGGSGGTGGGGNGGAGGNPSTAGTDGLGGGGGNNARGGNGIVVIAYATGLLTATGGTITTGGGNTIHTFTSSGTFTITSGSITLTGGGGGGGYYGGGGGGAAGSTTGGGGGGSSYTTGASPSTQSGAGAAPGNAADADWTGSAGTGGSSSAGTAGLVVLRYTTGTAGAPDALTGTNFQYEDLEYQLDLSQVRTRVTAVGGGGTTTAPVAAAATTIPVNECAWYSATGGTILARGQYLTYTGRSAASGPGNITGVPAAGTGSISIALLQGDEVQVVVTQNDATAQSALAALEGGDGIHEEWIEDSSWTSAAASLQASASLAAFKNTDIRGSYSTYDAKTKVGATVAIVLPSRGISASVTLQRVQQTHVNPNRWHYTCEFAIVWSDVIDLLIGVVSTSANSRK